MDIGLSNSKEECLHCGSLVSETLRKEKKREHEPASNINSSLALPKIQTAYKEFSISRLTFDIGKIDSFVDLTTGDTACIIAANKKHVNTLLTRLCVRALMSNRQGGFNSSKVIFVDAGNNTSDVYQCVNFARQYGLDIKKVLQSIVVSRSFTIYQLSNTIINELPGVIEQFSSAKVIIIGELLSMFVNDPQVQIKEAESLIRQIINAVRKLCTYNNILSVISFCSNNITKTYARLILQRIDKSIEITRLVGNSDKKNKNNNDLSIDIRIKNKDKNNHSKQQHYSILLQEKMLHLVSDR